MKKYSKVVRHGKKGTHLTVEGAEHIVVMEKLDGANASFKRNLEDGIECFSRNTELGKHNTLRGFLPWAIDNVNSTELLSGHIYFGEWLVRHKLDYGEHEKEFYLFDVYDEVCGDYIPFEDVRVEADRLGLNLAPVLYEGPFKGTDHLQTLVGRSKLRESGEGIVIKNYGYKDRHGDQVFTKIVSDDFAEKSRQKKQKLPQQANELDDFVDTFLTKARVEKTIGKLIDEGVIDEDPDVTDTGTVLKNSASSIADDIIEEEYDELVKVVKKKVGKKYPQLVREVLEVK